MSPQALEKSKWNPYTRQIVMDKKVVRLTRKEYDLFETLVENRGQVVSRQELLKQVWGYEYPGGTRTVDVHVLRLRQKLGDDPNNGLIETVRGVGYRVNY